MIEQHANNRPVNWVKHHCLKDTKAWLELCIAAAHGRKFMVGARDIEITLFWEHGVALAQLELYLEAAQSMRTAAEYGRSNKLSNISLARLHRDYAKILKLVPQRRVEYDINRQREAERLSVLQFAVKRCEAEIKERKGMMKKANADREAAKSWSDSAALIETAEWLELFIAALCEPKADTITPNSHDIETSARWELAIALNQLGLHKQAAMSMIKSIQLRKSDRLSNIGRGDLFHDYAQVIGHVGEPKGEQELAVKLLFKACQDEVKALEGMHKELVVDLKLAEMQRKSRWKRR